MHPLKFLSLAFLLSGCLNAPAVDDAVEVGLERFRGCPIDSCEDMFPLLVTETAPPPICLERYSGLEGWSLTIGRDAEDILVVVEFQPMPGETESGVVGWVAAEVGGQSSILGRTPTEDGAFVVRIPVGLTGQLEVVSVQVGSYAWEVVTDEPTLQAISPRVALSMKPTADGWVGSDLVYVFPDAEMDIVFLTAAGTELMIEDPHFSLFARSIPRIATWDGRLAQDPRC